jgi:membrane protein DedA with SNARE-associated domain
LAASGKLSIAGILVVALVGCLLCDLLWYWAGRHFGAAVMRTLCRISLSSDSCVLQSEVRFERWGGGMLLTAKFVPGLDAVAPPLMGAMRLPVHVFVLLDGLGSLLWAGVPVGLGHFFAAQVDTVLAALASAGTFAFELVLGLTALVRPPSAPSGPSSACARRVGNAPTARHVGNVPGSRILRSTPPILV